MRTVLLSNFYREVRMSSRLAALFLLSSVACSTQYAITRPPRADDLAQVNEWSAAPAETRLNVIKVTGVVPQEMRAAHFDKDLVTDTARTPEGKPGDKVPLAAVYDVHITNRSRGMAEGMGLGAATGFVLGAVPILMTLADGSGSCDCGGYRALLGGLWAAATLVGGVVGGFIGHHEGHTYDISFEQPKPPEPPEKKQVTGPGPIPPPAPSSYPVASPAPAAAAAPAPTPPPANVPPPAAAPAPAAAPPEGSAQTAPASAPAEAAPAGVPAPAPAPAQ